MVESSGEMIFPEFRKNVTMRIIVLPELSTEVASWAVQGLASALRDRIDLMDLSMVVHEVHFHRVKGGTRQA